MAYYRVSASKRFKGELKVVLTTEGWVPVSPFVVAFAFWWWCFLCFFFFFFFFNSQTYQYIRMLFQIICFMFVFLKNQDINRC